MTRVTFQKKHGIFRAVEVSGHAGYAAEGEDIVCAAITSAIQYVHILLDDVLLIDLETKVDQEATYIAITLPENLSQEVSRQAQQAIRALRVHYGEMEKEYAQFIQVMEVQYDA